VGLTLPSELTEPLGWIGLTWPEADEELLFEAGQRWMSYAEQVQRVAQEADTRAARVWQTSSGDAVDAFQEWWTRQEGPSRRLAEDAAAATLIGGALMAFAAITLALKVAFIVQLIILAVEVAQAIATAFVTFGATTAEVPGFIAATRLICRELIQQVITHITTVIKDIFERAAKLLKKAETKLATRAERQTARDVARNLPLDPLTPRLQKYFDESEVTSAGRSFYEPHDAAMRQAARDVVPEADKYTIDLHGNPSNAFIGNDPLSPNELAHLIRNDPHWNQQPIRLICCETGKHPQGFAQQLADGLDVPVHAPDKLGWSDRSGKVFSSSIAGKDSLGRIFPKIPPDGTFIESNAPAAP
jgi:hypothetical protein